MIQFTLTFDEEGSLNVSKSAMSLSSKLVKYFVVTQEDIIAFYVLSKIYYISDPVRVAVMNINPAVYNYIQNNTQEILDYYMIIPKNDSNVSKKIKACKQYFTNMELQKQNVQDYLRQCLYTQPK